MTVGGSVGAYHLPEKSGWADRAFCVTNQMEWILPFTPCHLPNAIPEPFCRNQLKKTGKCDGEREFPATFFQQKTESEKNGKMVR